MKNMIPRRFEPIAFGFVLSGLMSSIISAISTFRAVGVMPNFAGVWMGGWIPSWIIAFPVVLVVAPLARRLVHRLVKN